jgi:hypothetical protein
LERDKKSELRQLQTEVAEVLASPQYLREDRESILIQKRQGAGQTPLKAQFSIFIGEFVEQELEYMHNKITSYYK